MKNTLPPLSVVSKMGFALSVLVFDQWTKALAVKHLYGAPPRVYFSNLFRLEYAENSGAFLSLGSSMSPDMRFLVFVLVVGAFLIGMSWVLFRDRTFDRLSAFAFSMMLGGGAANLLDRSTRPNHSVVDFLNLGIGSLRTGIFNFADVAIMLGVALLAWKSLSSSGGKITHPEVENQKTV